MNQSPKSHNARRSAGFVHETAAGLRAKLTETKKENERLRNAVRNRDMLIDAMWGMKVAPSQCPKTMKRIKHALKQVKATKP